MADIENNQRRDHLGDFLLEPVKVMRDRREATPKITYCSINYWETLLGKMRELEMAGRQRQPVNS